MLFDILILMLASVAADYPEAEDTDDTTGLAGLYFATETPDPDHAQNPWEVAFSLDAEDPLCPPPRRFASRDEARAWAERRIRALQKKFPESEQRKPAEINGEFVLPDPDDPQNEWRGGSREDVLRKAAEDLVRPLESKPKSSVSLSM